MEIVKREVIVKAIKKEVMINRVLERAALWNKKQKMGLILSKASYIAVAAGSRIAIGRGDIS